MASTAYPDDAETTPLDAEELYDDIGQAYEVAFEGVDGQLASLKWVIEQLAPHKPAKVIDIGCGTGRPVCSQLAAAGHNVLGIDVSEAMVEAARKNVPDALFLQKDMRDFEAAPESYDAITVYFSFLASVTQDDIRAFMKRIYGWLKPGGVFIFGTVWFAGNNVKVRWMGRPIIVSSLSAGDAVVSVREAGFDVVKDTRSWFTPKGVEAGICKAEDVWEEPHVFVYAKKP